MRTFPSSQRAYPNVYSTVDTLPVVAQVEVIGAHGKANATLELHLVVVVHTRSPAFATVDCETAVLLVAALNNIATHKVGHGLLRGGAEFVLGSLRGLEHHVRMAVGIQLASSFSSGFDEVTTILVYS